MNALEFLVPCGLVPAGFAATLVADLRLPCLGLFASLGHARPAPDLNAHPLSTPDEAWVLRHTPATNLALLWFDSLGHSPGEFAAARWMLEPAHFQVGTSQVVLADPAHLQLEAGESTELAEAARPILAEAGWQLVAATPERWFLGHSAPIDLGGPSIGCAIGRDLAAFLPKGAPEWERRCRQTLNDIQMTWYAHPVNATREATGRAPVNVLWLSGNGTLSLDALPYSQLVSDAPLWSQARVAGGSHASLETFEGLSGPARSEDWTSWREALLACEARLSVRIGQLRAGTLDEITLVLTDQDRLRATRLARSTLWQFWRRGQTSELLTAPA